MRRYNSKYQKGDKVVLRKDLVVGEYYQYIGIGGSLLYPNEMHMELKDKKYLEIFDVDLYNGLYKVDFDWCITDEMISHKYDEEPVVRDEDWIHDLSNEELVQLKSMWESNK